MAQEKRKRLIEGRVIELLGDHKLECEMSRQSTYNGIWVKKALPLPDLNGIFIKLNLIKKKEQQHC